MELFSERRFVFPAPPEEVWARLAETDRYPRWWPWLTSFESDGLVAGARWRCTVRPPLRYAVRFTVDLDEVVPTHLLTARVAGDVAGRARIDLADHADGCELRLGSVLQPTGRALSFAATVATPIVRWGHDWVLDTGARQFVSRAIEGVGRRGRLGGPRHTRGSDLGPAGPTT